MLIRRLWVTDFKRGVFETLKNLTSAELISDDRLSNIFSRIEECQDTYNIFVAVDRDKVVGIITLLVEQKIIHSGGLVGHIEDVVVRKRYEGKGIGKVLVEYALKEARERGCYKIILDCSEKNVPFYEKCGFHRHEVCMRIDL